MTPSNTCKECGKEFSARGIHAHIKKAHSMGLDEYYTKHFPRKNLLTGTVLPFKDVESYFGRDFVNRTQLLRWCDVEDPNTVKPYILGMLQARVDEKKLTFAPCHLELETSQMPTVDIFKKHFGSYSAACREVGVQPMFCKPLHDDFEKDFSDVTILVDTREQQPLKFANQLETKLEFGDYTTSGEWYSKTFVDRKSESDFKGTLVGENLERFRRELRRAADMGCYMYIVVESSVKALAINNNFTPHKANLKFIYHNMRLLQHEFAGHCQFVFSGGRRASSILIPKLLALGEKAWRTDVQYFIDKEEMPWLG